MKIRYKMLAGLLGIPLIFAAVATFLIVANRKIQRDSREMASPAKLEMGANKLATILITGQKGAEELMAEKRRTLRESGERAEAEEGARRAEELIKATNVKIDEVLDSLTGVTQVALDAARKKGNQTAADEEAEELEELERIRASADHYKVLLNKYLRAVDSTPNGADEILNGEVEREYEGTLLPMVQEYAAARDEEFKRKSAGIEQSVGRISRLIAQSVIGSMMLAISIALLLSHSFSQPLKKLAAAANRIGRGGLASRIKVKSRDEVGQLARAFNQMADNLSRTTVSKDYVDGIIKSMGDSLVVVSAAGRMVTVNAATCRMLGYTEDELLGQPLAMLLTTEDSESLCSDLNLPGAVTNVETVYVGKDGNRIPVAFSRAAMQGDSKQSEGIVCVAKNITERRQVEAALQESEERYRDLFENAQDAIYVHDLNGIYISVNRAAEKIAGYTRDEILGKNFADFMTPKYVEQIRANLKKKLEGQGQTAYEIELRAKDGQNVPVEVSTRLIYENGIPVSVQGIARDITPRKRAEAERQAITEIVQGVITTSNLDELFSLAHLAISKLLPADNCYIALYDKRSEILRVPFCKDEFDTVASPQRLGKGLTAFILRSGRPMLLTPELIQKLVSKGEIEMVGTLPAAWLGVPLRTSTDIIGVLVVQHYEDKDAYSQQDLALLASVADQLGLAIERKQIEIELKTNEMQLNAAQQIAHIGSWEWDVIKKRLRWSEELFRIFGHPPRKSCPKIEEFFANVHPDDLKLVRDAIKQALRHKVIPSFDFRILRADMTIRVLQVTGEVIDDETGRCIRMWGTTQDITERKRAEKERAVISEVIQGVNLTANLGELLELVRQSLKKVLYAENCYVALYDKHTGTFEAPLFVDEIEDNPFPLAAGKSSTAYVFRTGIPSLIDEATFQQLVEQGELEQVGPRSPSWLGVPLKTPSETIGVLVVQHYRDENAYTRRDVEFLSSVAGQIALAIEQKRTEQALIESDRRFRDLFFDAPVGYHELDTEGRVTCVNTTELSMLGYSSEEMIGHHVWEFIEEAEIARATFAEKLGGIKPLANVERSFRRKDGTFMEVQLDDQILNDASGRFIGIRATMQDITERKQLENALRKERAFLRTLIDHLPDSVYVKDMASRKVIANLTEVRLSGLKSEAEVLGKDDFELHPQELAEKFLADDQMVLQTGQPVINREEYVIDSQGQKTWLLTTKIPLRDESEQIIGLIGLGRDITERKKLETTLRQSEEKYRELIENANDIIYTVDLSGRFTSINRSGERVMGYTRQEALQMNIAEVIRPEDAERVRQRIAQNLAGEGAPDFELEIFAKNGSSVTMDISSRLILQDGAVVGFQGIGRDISDRKRNEAELRAREAQLNEAQTIAQMGSWEWDVATNTTNWSDALYNIYGIQPQDILPTFEGYLSRLHPDDRENVSELVATALKTGQGCSYGHRIIRPDQSIRFNHVNLRVVLNEAGRPTKLFGTAQDITERVEMEEELKEARDVAIESARLKSEFLANMSHEIRTPMNGVIGMTGLLLDTDLDAEQRDCAETIRASGDSLLTIINDILDFSKIEAGKLQFETLDFVLNNAVEDTIELLADRAHQKKIELASLIYRDVPVGLRGDPGRLRQVLTNLIGNAIKFTERGEVILRVEKESETQQDVVVRFLVSDTGIGIDEAAQQNLFQAFTQADGSTTRKYGGTGLGLAISKQLVDLMGGQIGVTSAPGQGSTFWFTARFDKQLAVEAITKPSHVSLEKLRVLIVDDNATNRKILSHQLGSWGMIHQEAESGVQALELLRSATAEGVPYDLAVLDLMMPGMDGFEVARTIKADPRIAGMLLVMLTSFGERGDGGTAREAGVAAYLTKPVRQSQLYDCLANVIGQTIRPEETALLSLENSLLTKHALAEAKPMSNKLILLAEDNIVNQKVAVRQLQKLGYRADTVADGREAVEAMSRIPYDLIFMDCQMPEMDGYEATAEIRRLESETKHTTIVAMTAHALQGDREKCIAAGMDDYVSKPVKLEELIRVLDACFAEVATDKLTVKIASDIPPVDVTRFHEAMGDSPEEFSEILEIYVTHMSESLEELDEAITSRDHRAVESIAHNCVGTSANCGMTAVIESLRELEEAGHAAHLENAQPLVAQTRLGFERIREFLKEQSSQSV